MKKFISASSENQGNNSKKIRIKKSIQGQMQLCCHRNQTQHPHWEVCQIKKQRNFVFEVKSILFTLHSMGGDSQGAKSSRYNCTELKRRYEPKLRMCFEKLIPPFSRDYTSSGCVSLHVCPSCGWKADKPHLFMSYNPLECQYDDKAHKLAPVCPVPLGAKVNILAACCWLHHRICHK